MDTSDHDIEGWMFPLELDALRRPLTEREAHRYAELADALRALGLEPRPLPLYGPPRKRKLPG